MSEFAASLDAAALPKKRLKLDDILAKLDTADQAALLRALDDRDEFGNYRVSSRRLEEILESKGFRLRRTRIAEIRAERRAMEKVVV